MAAPPTIPVPVSGSVALYPYDGTKVIEHAFRRATGGKPASGMGAEEVEIAQDCLFTLFGEWINEQRPLWTTQYHILSTTIGSPDVFCPTGTVDIVGRSAFWKVIQPWRGMLTDTNGNNVSVLVGGQPNADVTITGPEPGFIIPFQSPTTVNALGILQGLGYDLAARLAIYVSNDGVNWTLLKLLPATVLPAGQWTYFNLNPSLTFSYLKVVSPGANPWTINQVMVVLPGSDDIPLGILNVDDYYNLPDKQFQNDRPNSVYIDRQLAGPILRIWPTPSPAAFYNGTVTALTRRYIMDPGMMANAVEVPPRFLEAIQWRLASRLFYELPDNSVSKDQQGNYFTAMLKQQRIQMIEQNATRSETMAWSEERSSGPLRLTPGIGAYTK